MGQDTQPGCTAPCTCPDQRSRRDDDGQGWNWIATGLRGNAPHNPSLSSHPSGSHAERNVLLSERREDEFGNRTR